MRLNQSNTKRRQAISLTPLIDVVFILLLFFMLSSSFIPWRQINVSMPTATSQSKTDVMRLEILDNKGRFVLDNQDFLMSDKASLISLVTENPDAIFLIKAKPEIETGVLVGLLDQLTLAGAKNVSIAAALKGN
ncbi:MAG: ExbD/TolR family protein [Marinomonas sp.]|uniref:ExbD/TolR family protein n=1 Tax=unclassified Marinomonas TaxID=196814 RepID=UPI000AC0C61C|nr:MULTISPECIES: biopolymer transporter ExbD [unclassified Marinomonas]